MRFPTRAALFLALASGCAEAAVDHFDVISRSVVLDGGAFGESGSYEKIVAKVYFRVKPGDPHNGVIVDVDKAATNPDGDVTFSADLLLLRPTALEKGNGALLLEIPNRGHKGLLSAVNGGTPAPEPVKPSDFGDAWLLRQGYTVAWVGWQWDAPAEPGSMRLYAPIAHGPGGAHIGGLLRDDFCLARKAYDVPLGHLILGAIGGTEYPVSDPLDARNVLTVRDGPNTPRSVVARANWRFSYQPAAQGSDAGSGGLVPDNNHIHLNSGFEPGKIYELVYVVQDPVVAGLGLAAVRDLVSQLKYEKNDIAQVSRAYAIGVSQCGRFLRHFAYQGFNADEHGRQVLDGMLVHVAGAGRGSFNHRFAQPSRDAQPMAALFYPTDLFPFSDLPELDPSTGESAGLLDSARAATVVPRIFYTNTSHEYWGRSAALIHASADGTRDLPLADTTRIYFFSGLQHFSRLLPPVYGTGETMGQNRMNTNPVRWLVRAMITNMNGWVRDGIEPPASRYPRIDNGTLVPLGRVAFPRISGVSFPRETTLAWRLDFGPGWKWGIIDYQPPIVGRPFPALVPQVDADGNDVAGVQIPQMAVPLATYTGWNLRDPSIGSPDRRLAFIGSYLPFAATEAGRTVSHDPRRAIGERYSSEADYLDRFRAAAAASVRDRWMLAEDLPAAVGVAEKEWEAAEGLGADTR